MTDLGFIYTAVMGFFLLDLFACSVFRLIRPKHQWNSTAHIAPLLIMGGILAAKAVSGMMKGHSENESKKAEAKAFNDFLAARGAKANEIEQALADNGYSMYGPQVTTGTTATQGGGTSTTHGVTDTSQIVDPAQAAMKAKLEALIMGKLGQPEQITEGEKAAMLERIGVGQRGQEAKIGNAVARMNLGGTSLQSTMLANPAANAANYQRAQYLGSEVPQANRDLATQARNEAAGLLNAWKGTHGVSDSTTKGSTWGTGTSTTTAPPNMANILGLAQFETPSPQANTNTGYNPWAAGLGGAADLAAQLYTFYQGQKKPVYGMGDPYATGG